MADEFVETKRTLVTLPVFIRAVIRAWSDDAPCSREAVAVLWAQYMIETGGKDCYGWNIGNVKHVDGDGFDYHCLTGVWEGMPPAEAGRLVAAGQATLDLSSDHAKAVGSGQVSVIFQPPHPATRFCDYPDLDTAMRAHLVLLAKHRYAAAWPAVLAGDYRSFAMILKERGYFTASAAAYAAGMRRPFDDAFASDAFDSEPPDTMPIIHPVDGGSDDA